MLMDGRTGARRNQEEVDQGHDLRCGQPLVCAARLFPKLCPNASELHVKNAAGFNGYKGAIKLSKVRFKLHVQTSFRGGIDEKFHECEQRLQAGIDKQRICCAPLLVRQGKSHLEFSLS